jgi:hypothetical protein
MSDTVSWRRAPGRTHGRTLAVVVAAGGILSAVIVSPGRPAEAEQGSASYARWIARAQLPDGAITQFPDRTRIDPYLANYAALGLASAFRHDHDPGEMQAAWRWLAWYQGHMGRGGYVTDYTVGPGPDYEERSTGDQDSTDGYAGTFLMALRQAYASTGDRAELRTFRSGIRRATTAIRSTQQADGLTWATPSYHAKLLMDLAEAYAGLRAAQYLAVVLGSRRLASTAGLAADRMQDGVSRLWRGSQTTGAYARAKWEDGSSAPSAWGVYYPDAVSQMWLLAVGNRLSPEHPLVSEGRASRLVGTFEEAWPQWDSPAEKAAYDSGPHTVEYWPMVAGALLVTGRRTQAMSGIASIRKSAAHTGLAWPFSVATAGQVESIGPG